jgi:formate-dependent nitrite reductase cytochrome c552 subunit
VASNGCDNCHKPHNAGGPQRLLTYREEEKNCYLACHNGKVSAPAKNILAQSQKISAHREEYTTIGDASGVFHKPDEEVNYLNGHVECQDCHNPHSTTHLPAQPPLASGSLANVKGVDEYGLVKNSVLNEYELCFKCHANSNTDTPTVYRYRKQINTRLAFARNNPSFHPVIGLGRNPNVPSLPSKINPNQAMNAGTMIYCTDCHSSDESAVGGSGPNGPHGSIYAPILRERYERVMGTADIPESYALCYRCHDRDSIRSDISFQKRAASNKGGHSGHLAAAGGGTPCSVCHDPHGVMADGTSGDHTKLINFDSVVVQPLVLNVPLYMDKGQYSGSCTLICHGVTHDGSTQFTYP